jgi:hypothetical protein
MEYKDGILVLRKGLCSVAWLLATAALTVPPGLGFLYHGVGLAELCLSVRMDNGAGLLWDSPDR